MCPKPMLTGVELDALLLLDDNQREFFEERAGIIEEGTGLARLEAERQALRQTYRYFHISLPE